MDNLQQLLGTDKRNPSFTICKNSETDLLHVYYGGELFEKVPDDGNDPQYKLMVARLYNAGLNATKLTKAFGPARKTMRRWGHALKNGDPEELVRVLAGRGWHRKLTPEIRAYVRIRFPVIHSENPSSYSKVMRGEISDVYDVKLCAESLRPLFREMKIEMAKGDAERETDCECAIAAEEGDGALNGDLEQSEEQFEGETGSDDRNRSPVSETPRAGAAHFVHHLGVLMFAEVLLKVGNLAEEWGWMAKQWLATLLLGAVNIEQSKMLDFEGLELMLGRTLRSRRPQRGKLEEMAAADAAGKLLPLNAAVVDVPDSGDFYYDPHGKHCTSQKLRLLKGWCGGKHFADKVLHMDFIHAASGHPVYIAYYDNYDDLRERFGKTVKDMRAALGIGEDEVLTLVLDRGIYSKKVLLEIAAAHNLHIVTWEKNYKRGEWNDEDVAGNFVMERCRNSKEDVKQYSFRYMDETWEKDPSMRLLRVEAKNPNGNLVELGILTDDLQRPAREIISLMFNRWIQENDFKYLEKHFGINEITSYASIPYKELEKQVEDKQVKSGEYKALEKERQKIGSSLKGLLLRDHRSAKKSGALRKKIEALDLQDKQLTGKMEEIEKKVSKLESLIEDGYSRLDVSSKQVMDILKLIARNSFYANLRTFKEMYNNYRDDHEIFRNLTRAHGLLIERGDHCEVCLYPTASHPPMMRKTIGGILEILNAKELEMPDNSGRKIWFRLGKKAGIVIADENLV